MRSLCSTLRHWTRGTFRKTRQDCDGLHEKDRDGVGIAAKRNTCSDRYLVICPGVVKTLCHRIAHPGVSVYTRRTILEILLFVEHRPISRGSDTEHT